MTTLRELEAMEGSNSPFGVIPKGAYLLFIADPIPQERKAVVDGKTGLERLSVPAVRVRYVVVSPGEKYDNRSFFQSHYFDPTNADALAFLKQAYQRVVGEPITGRDIADDQGNVDGEKMAQVWAAGMKGGRIAARVGIRKQRRQGVQTTELENFVSGWAESLEGV